MELELGADLVTLLQAIVDIESVSGNEKALADAVEHSLRSYQHLNVERNQDLVIARTDNGKPHRIVIAGHLDTVPVANNLPSRLEGDRVYGRGAADMKAGIAVMLAAAAKMQNPVHDLTWIFYDHEEVEASRNGLGRLSAPELQADLAILMEPTSAQIEAGCQGSVRFEIETKGVKAHSARAWLGHNAIHDVFDVLARLYRYKPRVVAVDGLEYREGLNAVAINGGVATNIIPDSCTITINFRFAPDRDEANAHDYIKQLFLGYTPKIIDSVSGARPGLNTELAQDFVKAVKGNVSPKYGWTDVARFAALGIPALNYGPGDPGKAHTDDEYVEVSQLHSCFAAMLRFLG
ncbi:MAG: succinyl-diaminopimelate desuccinylase [Propionibacteriaceae bacterium]|nr:succinyl-diaminopimelate desuccinylase [Propionibacteriaceae bacterium]